MGQISYEHVNSCLDFMVNNRVFFRLVNCNTQVSLKPFSKLQVVGFLLEVNVSAFSVWTAVSSGLCQGLLP